MTDWLPGDEPPERFTGTAESVLAMAAHSYKGGQRALAYLRHTAARIGRNRERAALAARMRRNNDPPVSQAPPGQPSCAWCGHYSPALEYAGMEAARELAWHAGRFPTPITLVEARQMDLLTRLGTSEWACPDSDWPACSARRDKTHPERELHGAFAHLAATQDDQEEGVAFSNAVIGLCDLARVGDEVLALTAPGAQPAPALLGLTLAERRRYIPLAGHSAQHNAALAAGLEPPPEQPMPAQMKPAPPPPGRSRDRNQGPQAQALTVGLSPPV